MYNEPNNYYVSILCYLNAGCDYANCHEKFLLWKCTDIKCSLILTFNKSQIGSLIDQDNNISLID